MKKLIGISLLLLLLVGCSEEKKPTTTSTSSSQVEKKAEAHTLTMEALVVAVYLENYQEQHPKKNLVTALNDVLGQKEFAIREIEGTYYANQTNGEIASDITVNGATISSRNYKGEQLKSEETYSIRTLTNKYSKYQKRLKRIFTKAQGNSDEIIPLTTEEVVAAAYVEIYLNDAGDVSETIRQLLADQITLTENAGNYQFVQNVSDSQIDFTVEEDQIIGTLASGTKKYAVSQLEEDYQHYQGRLAELVAAAKTGTTTTAASEEEATTPTETIPETSTVNTKNLTSQQAITWVENYLATNNSATPTTDSLVYETQMVNRYLLILMHRISADGLNNNLAEVYRVDGNGNLQKSDRAAVTNTASWTTVSTQYLE